MVRLGALVVVLLCAALASAGSNDDTFEDCLEKFGDTVCKTMRDDGNMNSACGRVTKDCAEQAEEAKGQDGNGEESEEADGEEDETS